MPSANTPVALTIWEQAAAIAASLSPADALEADDELTLENELEMPSCF